MITIIRHNEDMEYNQQASGPSRAGFADIVIFLKIKMEVDTVMFLRITITVLKLKWGFH